MHTLINYIKKREIIMKCDKHKIQPKYYILHMSVYLSFHIQKKKKKKKKKLLRIIFHIVS